MAKIGKKALDGNVETLLLAILAEAPSYGYQTVQDLNERAAGLLAMGEGTVYPVLHRLEERGSIEATWRDGETGRRRKYYRLTVQGRRCLKANREQWSSLVRVMNIVLGPTSEPAHAPHAPEPKGGII